MKLLRIKITDPAGFRSLPCDFEHHFRTEWNLQDELAQPEGFAPFVCAGPNGSGKSNLLEALAAIFFNIESRLLFFVPRFENIVTGETQLLLDSSRCKPDAYELEYLIPVQDYTSPVTWHEAHVVIKKSIGGEPTIEWLNRNDFSRDQQSDRQESLELLPKFVLGYSSGENEILSLPFFKMRFVQLDEYINYLNRRENYPGQPESRLVYLDNSFSQAISICIYLFFPSAHLRPFQQSLGLERLLEFRIVLRHPVPINPSSHQSYSNSIVTQSEGNSGAYDYSLPILRSFEKMEEKTSYELIDKLKKCSTCYFEDHERGELILDYWVNEATSRAFKSNFTDAIELFQSLQILLTLNLYAVSDATKQDVYASDSHYVSETIPTLASDERVMRFKFVRFAKQGLAQSVMLKDLSDGEHQLLHSLGLCLLFKNTNSLVLLDEPETHFNPSWRASFISLLNDCFEGAERTPEMLVTTHSPFLISDSKPDKVLVFSKDNTSGEVSISHPDYNTLGASINKITMKTFGKRETIGGHAQAILEALRTRFEHGNEDKEALITEIHQQLGDSIEKLLLVKAILDSDQPNNEEAQD
ncbi:MAG: restriction system-associated AAA family ATPase [Pseudomonadota bacterium]